MAILIGAAALAVDSNSAMAQAPLRTASAQIDSQKVIADVRRIIAEHYVLADVRPKLDAALGRGLAAGRYNLTDPQLLAEVINADMAAVAHDKHLGIRFDPGEEASLAARPPGAGADDAPATPEEVRQATKFNHGIVEMKVLPGNVRYIDLIGFFWGGKPTAEAYNNAIRFLKDGDAAIIDLRHNGGGSPEAVRYLISHFLPADKPIVTFYMGASKVDRFKSLASLAAGRLVGKPLYVLTSGMTASAAEEFTGHVAGFKLGEVIGDTTAGAGFRNAFFPIVGGYVISVSTGRAVLASTGKDWEGIGIAPTSKVDPDKALQLAQVHALRRLAASADARTKAAMEATATMLGAQVDPVKTELPLQAYTGAFGDRTIALELGSLIFQRQGAPKHTLIAIGASQFTFEDDPMSRVRFTVAGNSVTELELLRSDGSTARAARTQ